jgi:hypothetical protein
MASSSSVGFLGRATHWLVPSFEPLVGSVTSPYAAPIPPCGLLLLGGGLRGGVLSGPPTLSLSSLSLSSWSSPGSPGETVMTVCAVTLVSARPRQCRFYCIALACWECLACTWTPLQWGCQFHHCHNQSWSRLSHVARWRRSRQGLAWWTSCTCVGLTEAGTIRKLPWLIAWGGCVVTNSSVNPITEAVARSQLPRLI